MFFSSSYFYDDSTKEDNRRNFNLGYVQSSSTKPLTFVNLYTCSWYRLQHGPSWLSASVGGL